MRVYPGEGWGAVQFPKVVAPCGGFGDGLVVPSTCLYPSRAVGVSSGIMHRRYLGTIQAVWLPNQITEHLQVTFIHFFLVENSYL